ncbi:MAG TPA: NUDIX hydrolase [Planctomycetes bacterium]|nr:NUDIX hydrolase [Planctomycetaceae bacterium]HIM29844.1 NUDIX hydrolase [Planctomycetota bacterium]
MQDSGANKGSIQPVDDATHRKTSPRRGAVGVIVNEGRLLAIRRSDSVRAPRAICFPGGEIEAGEGSQQTVIRELAEEMGLRVTPTHELWTCTTRSNVHLTWWQCTAECLASITPNSDEVSAYFWVTPQELLDFSDLLTSNREFLAAWSLGDVPLVGIVSPHNEG